MIFSPAFTLPLDLVEILKAELGNNLTMIEADYYQLDMLKQHHLSLPTTSSHPPPQINLIFINSLRGLETVESLMSHTEKIYYFIVNYNKDTIEKLRTRDFEECLQSWFSGGSTRFVDGEHLNRYIDEEAQFVESGVPISCIKKQRNVQVITTDNLEKDLVLNLNWAK